MKTIYWLRRDLRLAENPALNHASQQGEVYPIFVLPKLIGSASQWWLASSLTALVNEYAEHGISIKFSTEDAVAAIDRFCDEINPDLVVWNRDYSPSGIKDGAEVKAQLEKREIASQSFNAQLLIEPTKVFNKQGGPFKVFTPFWRHCKTIIEVEEPLPFPSLSSQSIRIDSSIEELGKLKPSKPNWAEGFDTHWKPGEEGAQANFNDFIDSSVDHYGEGRDFPALAHTSRLSPHLAWGEIGPQRIYRETTALIAARQIDNDNAAKFLSEIGWREFCKYLMVHFPNLSAQPFNTKFEHFPWAENQVHLRAWQQGETGYPIVDAGMRELWQTGYMHNRVRMIVASFLTKHLLLDWRSGMDWFWDTLVDADIASNAAGWQWAAGCGADAAPYFRIFNPTLQAEKFDKEGAYIKHWVPELEKLNGKWLFRPWTASTEILVEAGIELGKNYPLPIVDHKEARERALSAYQAIKSV
ncbi:MAG: deoxyribodipyrimidine photo-lyase [Pseudomonadota bacterium]